MFESAVGVSFPRLDDDAVGELADCGPVRNRDHCLKQILGAFADIADFDDIHQAAERLRLIQDWIRSEMRRAAADPIFAD